MFGVIYKDILGYLMKQLSMCTSSSLLVGFF